MAFVAAMNSPDLTKTGVNGSAVYTEEGVGDRRVTLFTMLNRGLEGSYIEKEIAACNLEDPAVLRDLFVMAFQTRDIRGGKGEKDLFYKFITALHNTHPAHVECIITLIPTYGCWRDMWELAIKIPAIKPAIMAHTINTFKTDMDALANGKHTEISLLAKWLPREKSTTYKTLVTDIAEALISDRKGRQAQLTEYRKRVARLNKALKTTEINMCDGSWASIVPEHVPGRCLKGHMKAFFNQKRSAPHERRYPDSQDREECRQHFEEFTRGLAEGTKKANGSQTVMPHEIVSKLKCGGLTRDEIGILQGQWVSIRELVAAAGGLRACVPMCDFSGSMSGLPRLISLALGILISEVNAPAFKDHILTFDSDPTWHSFVGHTTVNEKLNSISAYLGQGLSTDFYKACMRVLDKMIEARVPVGEEPADLIVLTDMGWDGASSGDKRIWNSQVELIRNKFKEAGEQVWGTGNGWAPPRIVIWNLRAEFKDFHAKADQEGVVVLSGWSPSVLKALQKGGVQCMTPWQGMRELLDDDRYDPVRSAVASI